MAQRQPDWRHKYGRHLDPGQVTLNSTGLAVGTYTANLCVSSNDPTPAPATAQAW